MKPILFVSLLVFNSAIIHAQTIINGSVKDQSGNPLHFVYVGNNSEDKAATFTDSLGNFTLKINTAKGLYFSLKGYKDTSVTIKQDQPINIVLRPGAAQAAPVTISAVPIQQVVGIEAVPSFSSGGIIMPAHQQKALRGNQYLFDTFVHGYVIDANGQLIHNDSYLFDYDKIGGNLLLIGADRIITLVGWDKAPSFTLFTNQDQIMHFVQVPAIDKTHYVQSFGSGKKYGIYKLTITRFLRADYVNNGVSSHGNDFDSYEDTPEYFVVDQQTNQIQKLSLRKKSIKNAFPSDADKVNKFMAAHSSDDIDDKYLTDLGEYMNE